MTATYTNDQLAVTAAPDNTSARCHKVCPGGNRCVCRTRLDARPLRHTLHICADSDCPCHSRARYENKLTIAKETTK